MEERDFVIKFYVTATSSDEAMDVFIDGIPQIENNDWLPEVSIVEDPDLFGIKPEGTM